MELQEAFDAGFEAIKKYVDDGFLAFEERLKALEARALLKGDTGIGVKSAMQNSQGHLIITLGDGSQHDAGLVAAEPGQPGKDADPALIKSLVLEAVAALPPAEPGQPGKDADPALIKSLVLEAVAALPPAEPGQPGKDADPALIKSLVLEAVAALPPAEPGQPGKDADPALIKSLVLEAVAALPPAEPGQPGKDADPALIKSLVLEAVAALPPAEPGQPGKDADPALIKSLVLEAVAALPPAEPGQPGKDGLDVKDLLVVENGNLIATFSDGRTKDLGPFRGKDGRDVDMEVVKAAINEAVNAIPAPKDGEDGFGFDDLELCETEAGIVIRFAKGDRVKDFRLPIVRDCGVYKLGTVYNKGDGISHAGSFWIAQKDGVTDRPEQCDGWRLAVKRGKDRADPIKIGG